VPEYFLTNGIVKRLLGLKPVTDAVPALMGVVDAAPAKPSKKRCCGDGGYSPRNPPPSAAKDAAAIILALSQPQKLVILDALGADRLLGFLPEGTNSHKSIVLASRNP
jgi:hypothetical protein